MSNDTNHPVTLMEVAEAAHVSVSTASCAYNRRGEANRISASTVARVRIEADRLVFQPSQLARSLQSQRSGLIGVIVPDISNPFFAAIAREVTLQAEANGLSVLLADSRETTSIEVQHLGEFRSRRVEGLVIFPVDKESLHLKREDESGTPMVLIDRCFTDLSLTSVHSANTGVARQAIKQLLAHGHSVIGCLQGLPGTLPNQQRLTTIRDVMSRDLDRQTLKLF